MSTLTEMAALRCLQRKKNFDTCLSINMHHVNIPCIHGQPEYSTIH